MRAAVMACAVVAAALAAAGTSAALIGPPGAATVATIQPGQYRVTSTIAGQSRPTTRMECYAADDIAQLFEVSAGEGRCTDARRVVAGGKIDIARSCTGKSGTHSGTITGSYTPNSFTMRLTSHGPALPVPLDIRVAGRRVGATCAAD